MSKNKKHEELKNTALEAINKLHGDTSVGNLITLSDLEEIQSEVEGMIQGIKDDIKRRLNR